MNKKGQGALEYLLLIGGAVLVAVIVIVLLLSIMSTGEKETAETTAAGLCSTKAAAQGITNCTDITETYTIGRYTCSCDGTAPNCTASCA